MKHTWEHLRLHPERPQIRLIRRAVDLLRQGLFLVVPTDTTYVMMCRPQATDAIAAIRQFRLLDQSHLWALVCADLSQASSYVDMNNQAYRILRRCLPGSYTFILPASSKLPRRIFGKRRDVGIRMPDHPVCRMLVKECGEVLLATTLQMSGDSEPACDPGLFIPYLKPFSCAVLDAGWGGMTPTTVVDLCEAAPRLLRAGAGAWPA